MRVQLPYLIPIVAELIVIVVLITNNIRLGKKNKKYKGMLSRYKEKLRENRLDAMIKNVYHSVDKSVEDWNNVPYEVEFHEEKKAAAIDAVCVHLEYDGSLSTRKYVVNIVDELYLGHAKTNGVVLSEPDIDERHVKFIKQGKELYMLRVTNNVEVMLLRGKDRYSLTDVPIKVNDGDVLEFQNSNMKINLF